MKKRIIIVPYQFGSGSAKNLQQRFKELTNYKVLRVRKTSKTYKPRTTDYLINWGCSCQFPWENKKQFKTYVDDTHSLCVNKLKFFEYITCYNEFDIGPHDVVNIPEWTDDKNVAISWKDTIVCRTILNGHSGSGIILSEAGGNVPDAPLFVRYKKKKNEYRVHVFNNKVIDITQKKRRKDAEFVDNQIRNHKNGWVYAREDIYIPEDLEQQALAAMRAVDLKFGAVDIIWNEKENKCYVLEINTAPGLVGTTLEKYVEAFLGEIEND